MKDRKEYYKNYNSKCKFINIRFNMNNAEDIKIYNELTEYCEKLLNFGLEEHKELSKSTAIKTVLWSYFKLWSKE